MAGSQLVLGTTGGEKLIIDTTKEGELQFLTITTKEGAIQHITFSGQQVTGITYAGLPNSNDGPSEIGFNLFPSERRSQIIAPLGPPSGGGQRWGPVENQK